MSTLIYLGMLAVVSTAMFTWGRVLFQRAQEKQDATPPDKGSAAAEGMTSQQTEAQSNASADDKQFNAASGAGGLTAHPGKAA